MDEYISRDEVLEAIRYRVCQGHGNKEHICKRGSCAYCGIMEIMNDISSIEAADVQPVKHGRWIKHRIDDPKSILHGAVKDTTCSVCGKSTPYNTEYCMHCGARIDGDKDNNVRNLTNEETAIYESWIESEAKDTGVNIMDGDSK